MDYFKYWGKFQKPIALDIARGEMSHTEIVSKYDSLDTITALKDLAKKNHWFKASTLEEVIPYHLLAYHSLDVAAVGQQFYELDLFGVKQVFLSTFADEDEVYFQLFLFTLALHDLGKFSRSFQSLELEEY